MAAGRGLGLLTCWVLALLALATSGASGLANARRQRGLLTSNSNKVKDRFPCKSCNSRSREVLELFCLLTHTAVKFSLVEEEALVTHNVAVNGQPADEEKFTLLNNLDSMVQNN